MKEKPVLVYLIGGSLLILAVFYRHSVDKMFGNPMVRESMINSPIPVINLWYMGYATVVVFFISGFALFKGYRWARLFFIFGSIGSLSTGIAYFPELTHTIIVSAICFVFAILLYHPSVNQYFSKKVPLENKETVKE